MLKFGTHLPLASLGNHKDRTVKIDSTLKTPGSAGNVGRPRAERTASGGEAKAAEVKLSAASGAGSEAPIDGARIAEIKLAISEGRFKVNAEAIADGLIETARDLLQKQRQA